MEHETAFEANPFASASDLRVWRKQTDFKFGVLVAFMLADDSWLCSMTGAHA
jgi:hypothetical protein